MVFNNLLWCFDIFRGLAVWEQTAPPRFCKFVEIINNPENRKTPFTQTNHSQVQTPNHLFYGTLKLQANIFPALNQPRARSQSGRGHPYSPKPADITQTSQPWALSFSPPHLSQENTMKTLGSVSARLFLPPGWTWSPHVAHLHAYLGRRFPLLSRNVSHKLFSSGLSFPLLTLSHFQIKILWVHLK